MKKLESTWYNMVLVLTAIAVLAGAALGFVNDATKGPIEALKAQQLSDGIKSVLNAEQVEMQEPETWTSEDGKTETVVYRTNCGIAVKAQDANGFGGKLTVLVGFDTEGNIMGYRVLEHSETPGLGAKASFWFQTGQKGCIVGLHPKKNNLTVSKDGGDVDAITASTITSRAFLRAVNAAYAAIDTPEDAQSGASQQTKQNEKEEQL
ncbi:MAG: RnfABCDGE type electron transport complex subunit G [Bacteroidaceae bacterium]|nr:RnfABCDGE type electron transport complex subunit G [Bacteroidaceae bacterium]